jgi:cell division protein FtsQ
MRGRRARVLRRRAVAVAALALVVVAGYMLWLRNSSLFAVEEVEVTGVTVHKAEITAAIERAARGMTTLHLRDDELREAVQTFPTVASISADADLLHRVEVQITERPPVAEAKIGGDLVAVSGDGYLLVGLEVKSGELPRMDGNAGRGARVDREGAAQAAILAAAPKDLRDRLRAASWDLGRGGVVVALAGAPELRLGDGERSEVKWRSLVKVLAAGGSDARYVDVSVPERPVTG